MKTRNLIKKIWGIMVILLSANICSYLQNYSFAATDRTYITLNDSKTTVNGEGAELTTSTNNGGTSTDAKSANIEIDNVINITKAGTYEFTGTLSNGQISINSNDINGEVVIILNDATITCKDAPAIFVYNKEVNSKKCTVTIKTAKGTTNTITGAKIKQSVEGWEDQDEILYYIEKDTDDEGEYYERYKYDGAISSDVSLIFEGEGTLVVNSTEKEGIEGKGDITINSGNYQINSLDDGINACTDNESDITINGGTILVNVTSEAKEGDGIDSNNCLYINGGYIYAFAAESGTESGIDADNGIYINGGYVVAIGRMADEVSSESKQNFLQFNFRNRIKKDTLITITDKDDNPLVAFTSDRSYTALTISVPELTGDEVNVYEGGTIEGEESNGLYTKISSYTKGTEKSYGSIDEKPAQPGQRQQTSNNSNNDSSFEPYYIVLAVLVVLLIIAIIVSVIVNKKQ